MPHLVHVLGATDRDALHKHFAGLAHHDLRMRFGRSPDPAWLRLCVDEASRTRAATSACCWKIGSRSTARSVV